MRVVVLTDLDGTLLAPPDEQTKQTPPLPRSPAYDPLLQLLKLGATVVGVTGSKMSTHRELFFDCLPVEARKAGRVLMAVETGRRLFRGSPVDGTALEDLDFASAVNERLPPFDAAVVEQLTAIGQSGLKRFFEDLAQNSSLVATHGPHAFLHDAVGSQDARAPPVTTDKAHYPRVEVREGSSAVVYYGVPAPLGAQYFTIPEGLQNIVDGHGAGHNCFDCIPRGLSKALVVDYLLSKGELTAGRAIALGDSPSGNDEGLTRWHPRGIPFVTVCAGTAAVPIGLSGCHVRTVSGAEASAAVLRKLLPMDFGADVPFGLEAITSLVATINGTHSRHES
eukprot:1469074-Prymnesium_polylepis.1